MPDPKTRRRALERQAQEQRQGLDRTQANLQHQWLMLRDQQAALDTLRADILRQNDRALIAGARAKQDASERKSRGHWEDRRKPI